jgi:hypothetical protein
VSPQYADVRNGSAAVRRSVACGSTYIVGNPHLYTGRRGCRSLEATGATPGQLVTRQRAALARGPARTEPEVVFVDDTSLPGGPVAPHADGAHL